MACEPCRRITSCLQFPLATYGINRGTTFQNGDVAYSVDCPGRDPVIVQVPAGTITLTIPYPPGQPFYPPIVLECSGTTLTRNIPAFATSEQIQQVAEEMIDACSQAWAEAHVNCNQTTAFLNEEVQNVFTCNVDRTPQFTGVLPSWITQNTVLNVMTFTGAAGTFQANSQAAANATAQTTLDGWVQSQIDNDLLACTTFSPAELSPLHWFDASQLSFADNDQVALWPNAGSSTTPFGGSPSANFPHFRTNILNGLPVVRWVNPNPGGEPFSARNLTNTANINTFCSGLSCMDIFVVATCNQAGGGTTMMESSMIVAASGSGGFRLVFRSTGAPINQFQVGLKRLNDASAIVLKNAVYTPVNGSFDIFHVKIFWANATISININGTNYLNNVATGESAGTSNHNTTSWFPDDTSPTATDIPEVIICSSNLSQGDIDKVVGYAAWKYGLEGNLPIGFPYKNFPPP